MLQYSEKKMKTAEASIYLDNLRVKKNGKCSIKIRLSFNRKRKYFSTGIDLDEKEYEQVLNGQRRTTEQKELYSKLIFFRDKAEAVIKSLPLFTFSGFEERYFDQRNTLNLISFAFDKHIEQLKTENRLGTAQTYQYAIKSIESCQSGLTFAEIDKPFLDKYERFMLNNGKSQTTVGIYLRSLRAIYNQQNINVSLYPFGNSKKKYSIPVSRNIKKALTVEEIAKIYNFQTEPNSMMERAKDYWLFLYLSNGMNVKDFCLLKWKNIDGDLLSYVRAKTQRSRKETKTISVCLKPEARQIINRWGLPSISETAYIFPHLKIGMSAEEEQAKIKQLTKTINKYMKRLALELGLNKEVTTYFARHSFATVLKRSGAKIEMISELLGHSSVNVTDSYLDSFEKEQIQKETNALTAGFVQAV